MDTQPPRRTGLWALVGLLAVALVAVVVIALGGGDEADQPAIRSPSGGKGRPASEDTLDTLTANDVTFQDYGTQLPTSPAGPHGTANGRATGFDHSPAGSVLSAVHIFARSESGPGPSIFETTIAEQVTGPDKAKLLANAQRNYAESAARDGVPPGSQLTSGFNEARANRVSLWAYRVDAYDEAAANVNLLFRQIPPGATSSVYVNFNLTVEWSNGDWRLVAPLNGEFASVARPLSEVPASYVVLGKD